MKARVDALYRPPFHFDGITYICDADNRMVAYYGDKEYDEDDNRTGFGPLTVRGWGRISYLREPEALFDAAKARIHSIVPEGATPREAVDALNTQGGPGLNDPNTAEEERAAFADSGVDFRAFKKALQTGASGPDRSTFLPESLWEGMPTMQVEDEDGETVTVPSIVWTPEMIATWRQMEKELQYQEDLGRGDHADARDLAGHDEHKLYTCACVGGKIVSLGRKKCGEVLCKAVPVGTTENRT